MCRYESESREHVCWPRGFWYKRRLEIDEADGCDAIKTKVTDTFLATKKKTFYDATKYEIVNPIMILKQSTF